MGLNSLFHSKTKRRIGFLRRLALIAAIFPVFFGLAFAADTVKLRDRNLSMEELLQEAAKQTGKRIELLLEDPNPVKTPYYCEATLEEILAAARGYFQTKLRIQVEIQREQDLIRIRPVARLSLAPPANTALPERKQLLQGVMKQETKKSTLEQAGPDKKKAAPEKSESADLATPSELLGDALEEAPQSSAAPAIPAAPAVEPANPKASPAEPAKNTGKPAILRWFDKRKAALLGFSASAGKASEARDSATTNTGSSAQKDESALQAAAFVKTETLSERISALKKSSEAETAQLDSCSPDNEGGFDVASPIIGHSVDIDGIPDSDSGAEDASEDSGKSGELSDFEDLSLNPDKPETMRQNALEDSGKSGKLSDFEDLSLNSDRQETMEQNALEGSGESGKLSDFEDISLNSDRPETMRQNALDELSEIKVFRIGPKQKSGEPKDKPAFRTSPGQKRR